VGVANPELKRWVRRNCKPATGLKAGGKTRHTAMVPCDSESLQFSDSPLPAFPTPHTPPFCILPPTAASYPASKGITQSTGSGFQQALRHPDQPSELLSIQLPPPALATEIQTHEGHTEMKNKQRIFFSSIFAAAMFMVMSATAFAADVTMSTMFQGPKANKGTVSHAMKNGHSMLTLSDDFVVPDTPDPHWQLVDSKGNTYLLDKLKLKGITGDREKREIEVPRYIGNVAKVIIYCAWAEANLGEASFAKPVK
jgi:hypothetical protein